MPKLRVDDRKGRDRWEFRTDFDMNVIGGCYSYPMDGSPCLGEQVNHLVEEIFKIPGVKYFTVFHRRLTVEKEETAEWSQIVPKVREAFKIVFEITLEFVSN